MNIEREKPEKIEPWTEIPSAAIQAKLDSEIAKHGVRSRSKSRISPEDLPSIRSVLIDVFDSEEHRLKAEDTFEDGESPEEVLLPFLDAEPQWAVRCSVILGGLKMAYPRTTQKRTAELHTIGKMLTK